MTMLATPPSTPVITESVRKQLLVSLIADLNDETVEGLNAYELRELLRPLESPFLNPLLAAELSVLDTPVLKELLYRAREKCRRHFG